MHIQLPSGALLAVVGSDTRVGRTDDASRGVIDPFVSVNQWVVSCIDGAAGCLWLKVRRQRAEPLSCSGPRAVAGVTEPQRAGGRRPRRPTKAVRTPCNVLSAVAVHLCQRNAAACLPGTV
jgi:hypothetical protein